MITQNLHTHSSFSDGECGCEELVIAAKKLGFTSLGFAEHAYTPYDTDCCMKEEQIPLYYSEIKRLKEKYQGEIDIFLGLECDCYYNTPKDGLDFTIGSVHYAYFEEQDEYIVIDYLDKNFKKAIEVIGGGDIKRLLKLYYDNVSNYACSYKPDIVGHFDLIKKININNCYFDSTSDWYEKIIYEALAKIAESGCIIEVNTGGMARGYTQEPYPSRAILERMFDLKIPVTISSDSHNIENLNYWFDEAVDLLKSVGYRNIKQLTAKGFVDTQL